MDATRFRLQPLLRAFADRLDSYQFDWLHHLAGDLDTVSTHLHSGTCTFTFIEKQVINTECLEIGSISFKQIGKQERLQEITKKCIAVQKKQYLNFLY